MKRIHVEENADRSALPVEDQQVSLMRGCHLRQSGMQGRILEDGGGGAHQSGRGFHVDRFPTEMHRIAPDLRAVLNFMQELRLVHDAFRAAFTVSHDNQPETALHE
jgi:hypothetical protein